MNAPLQKDQSLTNAEAITAWIDAHAVSTQVLNLAKDAVASLFAKHEAQGRVFMRAILSQECEEMTEKGLNVQGRACLFTFGNLTSLMVAITTFDPNTMSPEQFIRDTVANKQGFFEYEGIFLVMKGTQIVNVLPVKEPTQNQVH